MKRKLKENFNVPIIIINRADFAQFHKQNE